MIIGLKRGVVELADHDSEWEKLAAHTVERLWRIIGTVAKDIQHVGSTAIKNIKAKPIIDIAVAVENFAEVELLTPDLEADGFMRRNWAPNENEQMLYAVGYAVPPDDRVTTHYIHIVKNGITEWTDYINFRDFLNSNTCFAKKYEEIKIRLAAENPIDPGREEYVAGKHDFIIASQQAARIWASFGKKFTKIEPILKGISSDKKYYIEAADECRYLLRIADISEYNSKKVEYERMKLMDDKGIPMSRPIDFGICGDGKSVYQLLTWCHGDNLEDTLSLLPETEQYVIGLNAGKILRKIHSVPVSADDTENSNWYERYSSFIDESIQSFRESGVQANSSDQLLKYFNDHRHLLYKRPSCYLHGDYHTGNMMYHDKNIFVIDWEIHLFDCYGDPWWEVLNYFINPHYSSGVVHGYFDGNPPMEFWETYSVYAAIGAVSSIPWAFYHYPSELDAKIKNCSDVFEWYDKMENSVPNWYLRLHSFIENRIPEA